MGLFNKFPYTDLNSINLDYTLNKLNDLYERGEALYTQLQTWQAETTEDLASWKADVEAGLASWKTATEASIDNKIQLLTAAINAAFSDLETQLEAHIAEIETTAVNAASAAATSAEGAALSEDAAAASATAAAGSASDAADTAESLSESLDQIATNASDITDLKSAIANTSTSWAADGECINAVGNADVASGSCRSDYIPVIAGQTIKLSGLKLNGVRSVCSYDANKTFVARVAGNTDITEYTYVVPTGVAYVRATGVSGVPVSYEYYGIYPIVQTNANDIASLKSANTAVNAVIGNNSFTFTSQDGYFITAVGNLDSASNSCATDYIPVTPGTTIKMTGLKLTSARSVCAYNDNRIFVSRIAGGTDDTEVTYLVPDGVAYIRATGSSGTPPTVIVNGIAKYFTAHHSDNAVRYVSATNGNDTYDGLTSNTAKATISGAISSGGLTIKVEPATYSETVTLTADHMKIIPSDIGLYNSEVADTPKIIINNLVAEHLTDIYIEDVECVNSTGYLFRFLDCRDVMCVDCSAHGSTTGAGFSLGTTFGKFIRCYAYSCGDSSHQIDGFNIQGYGFTEFVDCVAHDNSDDGISHHNGCTGFISGGEYYNNGKGGVASPAHGAYVDVTGVYSHNNKYGLYAANASVRTVKINVNNSVFKNNTDYDIQITDAVAVGWNNIYDTKDVTPGATFTEYN